ncbi:MAG: tRNA-dihydrouridine synthase [Deltaproteobacteria bacterium]|nr:tRNA-dihydrouridine synthase [Deltaproteobacteria bacterium]
MIAALLARDPVVLAPMEDVTDAVFRRAAREVGASLCVTELVGAEQIIADSELARRRAGLASDDRPTAIQIYGADPELLLRAARIAAASGPSFLDLNCGCWIPKIAARGAGAGWLRDPVAMVAMARRVVDAVELPVTVKTRIGWGPESHMPIVDLARRLEDAGVAALAIHCRTAQAGHAGAADWSWARRARDAVSIPVIVNGDVRSAHDVVRALGETGCAGAMVGRAAIAHPWIFREARAALAGQPVRGPSDAERVAMYRRLLVGNCARRGERIGLGVTRRYLRVLGERAHGLRTPLFAATSLAASLAVLDAAAS